jgi:hypothetical protein
MPEPSTQHIQLSRCPEKLLFSADVPEEAQCGLYLGHLGDVHETEPLPPSREDKSDGVHQCTWRVDEDGNPIDVQQLRLDVPDDEEETADA